MPGMSTPITLAAFPALDRLPAAERDLLIAALSPVHVPQGKTLFQPGDACQAYLLVTKGGVQVRLTDPNGHSITLYRVEAGETCVLTTSCLLASSPYEAEGIVESELHGYMLSAATFRQLLARSEGFRNFVFAAFGGRLHEMMMLVNEVAFRRMDQRLAEWLLRHPHEPLHVTHQQIADELGTAREVISRQLKEFERKGWLSLARGSISEVKTTALQDLAAV